MLRIPELQQGESVPGLDVKQGQQVGLPLVGFGRQGDLQQMEIREDSAKSRDPGWGFPVMGRGK